LHLSYLSSSLAQHLPKVGAEAVEAAAVVPADLPVEALAVRRPLQVQGVRLQHLRPLQEPQALRTRSGRQTRRLLPRMQIQIQSQAPPMR
jgi:hypothetical protein